MEEIYHSAFKRDIGEKKLTSKGEFKVSLVGILMILQGLIIFAAETLKEMNIVSGRFVSSGTSSNIMKSLVARPILEFNLSLGWHRVYT